MEQQLTVFDSREESTFYGSCIRRFLFTKPKIDSQIVECGSGDALPIIDAIQGTDFNGMVTSYEINQSAADLATEHIAKSGLNDSYQVINENFLKVGLSSSYDVLISDPPFLPSLSDEIIDPYLRGGDNGNEFTLDLIKMGYQEMVLMIPSYTDPVKTLEVAREHGYDLLDFVIAPMKLTFYSKDPEVYSRLTYMRALDKAFFSDDYFLLAGVHFKKQNITDESKWEVLHRLITTDL